MCDMDLLQAQHLLIRDACGALDFREWSARFRLPAHTLEDQPTSFDDNRLVTNRTVIKEKQNET